MNKTTYIATYKGEEYRVVNLGQNIPELKQLQQEIRDRFEAESKQVSQTLRNYLDNEHHYTNISGVLDEWEKNFLQKHYNYLNGKIIITQFVKGCYDHVWKKKFPNLTKEDYNTQIVATLRECQNELKVVIAEIYPSIVVFDNAK